MKTSLYSLLLIGFLPLFPGVPNAAGAVMTSLSSAPPSEERSLVRIAVPEGSFGTAYTMRYWNNYASAANRKREVGQTFVVPGNQPVEIEGFTLRIYDTRESLAGVSTNFTLSIYKVGQDDIPIGSPVYESTGQLPSELSHLSYITFLLDSAVTLEDGVRYGLKISYTSSSGGAQLSFAASSGNIYSEGKSFYHANSDGTDLAGMYYTTAVRDLDLAILYTPIPEGRATALLLGSLAGLGAWGMAGRARKGVSLVRSSGDAV